MRIRTILLTASSAALVACEEAPPPPPAAAVVVPSGQAAVVVPPGQPAVVVPPAQPAVVVPPGQPVVVIPTTAASLTTATKAPFGTYLVDSAGRALYVLEGTRNLSGADRCVGECLGVWPPLMTAGPAVAAAHLTPDKVGSTSRYGGSQATYNGWPLYYYHRDTAPGDTTGQDVHDNWGVWHLLSPSGDPIRPAGGGY